MDDVFTLSQIKEKWKKYQEAMGWRVLEKGKWRLYKSNPKTTDATRVEMIKIRNFISFPQFLEKF